jgi:F420-non-reducing hydrogenase iron-sulfur subunit
MNPDAVTLCEQPQEAEKQLSPQRVMTVFVCANCARPARAETSAGRPRPVLPDFAWPLPVRQIAVSCTGRLQPEHVLKAFESGSDAVCVIGCQEDDCHYLEGSKRCERRAAFLRSMLDEVGLGGERLLHFHLPGTAAEDMALTSGRTVNPLAPEAPAAQVAAIRDQAVETLRALPPNPLHNAPLAGAAEDFHQEVDISDDDNEE